MIENVSVSTRRLKYKSKFIELKLSCGDAGLLHVEIIAPSSGLEKSSFVKTAAVISKLVYSGIRKRAFILGKLEKLINVDNDVLLFMKNVVKNYLPLE